MFALVLLWAAVARPVGLITANDYPPSAIARNEQGSVLFKIVVRPDGVPDTCTILLSSGYKDLDDRTCNIVLERARFAPAIGLDNKAVYAVYRQVLSWALGRPLPPVDSSDLELMVNQAPRGVSLPHEVQIAFFHGADGRFGRCSAVSGPKNPPAELVDLACKSMSQSPGDPVRNSAGHAVDAIDMASVRFSLQK